MEEPRGRALGTEDNVQVVPLQVQVPEVLAAVAAGEHQLPGA